MRTLTRIALAAALAGSAFAAAPAQSAVCSPYDPCYQCVMYPCGPGDWVEFLGDKVRNLCVDQSGLC